MEINTQENQTTTPENDTAINNVAKEKRYLTIEQIHDEYLPISIKTIRKMVAANNVSSVRAGRKILVERASLEAFLQSRGVSQI